MNTTDNGRTEARSRANRRLRSMTIGTTALGIAATGSLGWLAAATYDRARRGRPETTIVSAAAGAGRHADHDRSAATTAPAATAAPTVSTTTGNAHAVSGGS